MLRLGNTQPGRTLIDGNRSWDTVAWDAFFVWNPYIGTIQFAPTTQSPGVGSDGDSINQVFFNSTVYGQSFGGGVLAVTTGWHIGNTRVEADVIFNNATSWDSYRGPLRFPSGQILCDLRRVALHEFGHVLGLDHPDEAGQNVSAIMNSMISDLDSLRSDDISGAQVLYPPQPPTITTQPQSQTANAGGTATFSVAAFGSPPLSYQWRRNGVNISGATTTNYVIPNVQTNHAGNYTVVVSNPRGPVTSATAVLSVNVPVTPPAVTTQPVSQTVIAGNSVTFSVGASGTAPLSYQWYRNNSPIAGATGGSYTISGVQPGDAGDYKVRVSNAAGSVNSAAATLTVQYAPVITAQPQSQTLNIGANVTFAVVAGGYPAATYQWKFKGGNIPGATASTYTRNNVQPANAGSYTVAVSNSRGSVTSQAAILTVNMPPTVTLNALTNGTALVAPATVSLTASASDTDGNVTQVDFYQGTTLLGTATTNPFGFTWNSVPSGSYTFTARATDNFGATATSAPVSVTVNPPTACISPPNGLVTWWPGDGNAGDAVGGRNGVAFGGTTFVAGKVGQAFSFDGIDGYVRLNAVATTAVDNWAMATWVYWNGVVGTASKEKQTLLYNGHEGNSGYGLIIPEPGLCSVVSSLCPEVGKLVILFGGMGYVTTSVALDQNAWNHVALVRENGVLKLYKNGTLAFSVATGSPNPPSATDGYTAIGAFPGYAFNGLVDEVMFFDTAINGDDARSLFAADNFGACKALVFTGITATGDGVALLNLSGQAGKNLTIFGSLDLLNWLPVVTAPNPTGALQITNSGSFDSRFYKAIAQ